jgi:Sigma-70 region 2
LFARHNVRIFRFVLRLVGDNSAAEDPVSEVFLEVWRQAGRFQGRSQVTDVASSDCPQQGPFGTAAPVDTSITTDYPRGIKCPTLLLSSFSLVFCSFPVRRLPMRRDRSQHCALGEIFKLSGRLNRK